MAQPKVDHSYIKAVQEGKFDLLKNLAILLGKKREPSNKRSAYRWQSPEGLTVYYDKDNDFILAVMVKEVVASSTLNNPLFVPGPWWGIVERTQEQIKAGSLQTMNNRLDREMVIAPAPGASQCSS